MATTDPLKKKRLLEAARTSKPFVTNDPATLKLVEDFIEYRKLKSDLEKVESDVREKVDNILLAEHAGSIVTTLGEIIAIPRSRSGIDKALLTPEEIKRATKTTEYVEMTYKAPAVPATPNPE